MSTGNSIVGYRQTPLEMFVLGVVSGCTATSVTHPIDSIRARLQTTGSMASPSIRAIILQQRFKLYRGLAIAYIRHASYSGTRMILYNSLRGFGERGVDSTSSSSLPSLALGKVSSGIIAGCIASFLSAPVDRWLLRTQLSVNSSSNRSNEGLLATRWFGSARSGFGELWRGSTPSIVRAGLVTAGQLGFYEMFRNQLRNAHVFGFDRKAEALEVASAGVLAGVGAVLLANPADVLKSRLMSSSASQYKGVVDCAVRTLKDHGPLGFYKGAMASATRQIPQTLIISAALEFYSKCLDRAKTGR
ncbi:mitochondrial solute carrier family 25 (mitochondrial dicarboxylate transporter) member 10 [Andalucia godoyi]|uniref:Mitochondrial solute carrier family 25 (Mitochondrial dicarboxylate transporter) member 10 n=1 Tax=Andalucia godoyi TaxID=505711 RepID=A0A8K0F4K8_ANDGO|nr:mitochondrial solute carrier family 25 (mitochondrial dicarboxylate transporter) member 10 [Andalucia godoyi]|eukprot:ANDGO_02467.mRNA.1 mitochondrial solute carrier family 25 (mitochondrial dicarboxylate transporter) member 10